MNKKSTGYILLMTMMVIAASIMLVTFIISKSSVYIPYARIANDREKASLLAFGGVHMAISQLTSAAPESEKSKAAPESNAKDAPQTPDKAARALLSRILPVLNRWQVFTLSKEKEGVEGQVRICVMSEDGKIDINQLYNFKDKKFVGEGQQAGDMKKALQDLFVRVQKEQGGKDLFEAFATFLKQRQSKLQDVTQLMAIKEFAVFADHVFYEPNEAEKTPLFLTDIFTVHSEKQHMSPWLFSQSLRTAWGLDTLAGTPKEVKAGVQEALKKFKQKSEWQTDWDIILAPLYKKKAKDIPTLVPALLDPTFEPTTFSVLSYGKIGKVTQKLLAIVVGEPAPDGSFGQVTIKKIYWL